MHKPPNKKLCVTDLPEIRRVRRVSLTIEGQMYVRRYQRLLGSGREIAKFSDVIDLILRQHLELTRHDQSSDAPQWKDLPLYEPSTTPQSCNLFVSQPNQILKESDLVDKSAKT
jgi:hypothetical protein